MESLTVQKVKNFHSLFTEHFELQYYQKFRKLKLLGCDYFYFLGTTETETYRFCTHADWIEIYHEERFLLNDPLKRVIENTKFIVLPWDQLAHIHGDEKRTMLGRVSFGLHNGLTISREHNNRKHIYALATETKDHELAKYLLIEKMHNLQEMVFDCISIFNQYINYIKISRLSAI